MAYQLDDTTDDATDPTKKKKLASVGSMAPDALDPTALPTDASGMSGGAPGLAGAGPDLTNTPSPGKVPPSLPGTLPMSSSPNVAAPDPGTMPPLSTTAVQAPQTLQPPQPALASVGSASPPTMSQQDWINYSPLTGKTEEEKAAALQANAAKIDPNALNASAFSQYKTANSPTGVLDQNGVMGYSADPAKISTLQTLAAHDTSGQEQADALKATNAGQNAINLEQAKTDATGNIASIKGAGGVYSSPAEEEKAKQELMRQSGFDAQGNFIGEPANNPNATAGMPANYDPNKPKQANNGYVDDKGVYHEPDASKPGEYIINGKVYDNPSGTGTPIRDAPSSGTGTAGGSTSDASKSFTGSDFSNYTADDNLRGTQISPVASDRLKSLTGLVDTAANKVGQGKSRGEIAQGQLDAFDLAAQPKLRDQLRSVGQRAASLGRLGMGDTAVEALNPYTDYLNNRAVLSKQLASETASGDIQDRLNNLDALKGTQGQTFSQEALSRGEFRSERDFQNAMARQAIEDSINQYQLGEQSKRDEFGRNATTANIMMGAGNTSGANAGMDWNAISSLLAPYLNKSK